MKDEKSGIDIYFQYRRISSFTVNHVDGTSENMPEIEITEFVE